MLLHLQPNLRIRLCHSVVKDLQSLGNLHLFLLQEPQAGDPGTADIVENIDFFQVAGLFANDAHRIFTPIPDAVHHIIVDFITAASIAIAAHHTGAICPASQLHVLLVGLPCVFGLDLLHALLIVIGPVCLMAGAHDQRESRRGMLTALASVGTQVQGVVVLRAVPNVLVEAIRDGHTSPSIAFSLDQQAAGCLPGEAQHGLPLVRKVLPVAPVN